MSADNGYIIRQNDAGKFTLQMYFASNDEYPPVNQATEGRGVFDTVADALREYNGNQGYMDGYWSEYGLTVDVPDEAFEPSVKVSATHEIWRVQIFNDGYGFKPLRHESFWVDEDRATQETVYNLMDHEGKIIPTYRREITKIVVKGTD